MRAAILLFPAKRANRAMLTSTMRVAFETTIERRRKRASQCRCRALSRSMPCVSFARMELPDRQEHIIDRVIVRAVEPRAPARQPLDQALAGDFVTTAAFPVHQLACKHDPKPSRP